jgi:tRNA threonylcarbamoyladenosine biosynthesis protein TsaE
MYHGRCCIYHVDLYRLSGNRDLYTIGIGDFLGVDGVTIVEWSERLLFPVEAALKVELSDCGDESRKLRIACSKGNATDIARLADCLEQGARG